MGCLHARISPTPAARKHASCAAGGKKQAGAKTIKGVKEKSLLRLPAIVKPAFRSIDELITLAST